MSATSDLCDLTATELLAGIAAGSTSAAAVLESCLARGVFETGARCAG